MQNGKHIINKVFLEVNTNSIETAYHLKDHLDVFFKERVLPYLENYFDTFQKSLPPKGHLQLEKIALDLSFRNSIDLVDLKHGIKGGIEKELEKKSRIDLQKHVSSPEKRFEDTFFHFLETGSIPWWYHTKVTEVFQDDTVFDTLFTSQDFMLKLRSRLQNERFRERLIKQMADDRLTLVCKHRLLGTDSDLKKETSAIKALMAHLKNKAVPSSLVLKQRQLLWDIVLCLLFKVDLVSLKNKFIFLMKNLAQIFPKKYTDELIEEKVVRFLDYKTSEKMLRILSEELSGEVWEREIPSPKRLGEKYKKTAIKENNRVRPDTEHSGEKDQNEQSEERKKPEYYIENAGLILLHPYLNQLLLNCKLLNNKKIEHPEIVAHLLHYIATRQEKPYEHHMVFEKFLCNIPIDRPINRNIELTIDMKQQAEQMLGAVVKNWTALGNASVGLLRNEYVQRPGKLILNEDNPKIIVERKTQDILLDKLPWGIGICKLPWKKKIIFTQW